MSPLRVGDRLAVLAGEDLGQRVEIPVRQLEEAHENAGAALRVGCPPGRLSGGGVLHRGAHLLARSKRNFGVHFAGHRLVAVDEAGRGAGDPLASDEMAIGDHANDLPAIIVLLQNGSDVLDAGR